MGSLWLGDVCFQSTSIADQARFNPGNSLQPIAVVTQPTALYPDLGEYIHGSYEGSEVAEPTAQNFSSDLQQFELGLYIQ